MKNNKIKIITISLLIVVLSITVFLTTFITAFAFTGPIVFDPNNPTSLFTEANTFECTSYDDNTKTITYDMNQRRSNVQVMDLPKIAARVRNHCGKRFY